MEGDIQVMKCECHQGQETMTSKQALVYVAKISGRKFANNEVDELLQFVEQNGVKSYLEDSCLILRVLGEYLKKGGKIGDNLFDNLHNYYWQGDKELEDEFKGLLKKARGKTQDE